MIRLSMIVALGRNRVIGIANVMPWHIPADLKYFKSQTLGKPIIMGRKTLQSIGKPLSGRANIVITRDPSFHAEGVQLASSLDRALKLAEEKAVEIAAQEIMIVGGGQIYQQAIERVTRLYLTEIDVAPKGDAYFPDYRAIADWYEVWREHHPPESDQPAFDFVIHERI